MDSTRGRSRKKPRRQQFIRTGKKRISALLITAMIVSLTAGVPFQWTGPRFGASEAFASAERESLWATASNMKYKEGKQQDVDIYVISEDNDVCPGNLSAMTLYLKNNTGQTITGGELSFRSRFIRQENGAFEDYEASSEEIVPGDTKIPLEPGWEEESEETDPEETDSAVLTEIQLEPGELREIFFEFYTDEEMGPEKASVTFQFRGEIGEKEISSSQRFHYSIGLPNVNLELRDGGLVELGVPEELEVWMSEPDWQDWAGDEEDESENWSDPDATGSEIGDETATDSEIWTDQTATDSEISQKEEEDREIIEEFRDKAMEIPEARVRYEVEIFGTDVARFKPRKAKEAEDLGWISCIYRLAEDVSPGIYYGKVKATGNWNRRSFTSEQGFLFEVTGEGRITLEDHWGGGQIQISGPTSSFPEADELELLAENLTAEEENLLNEKGLEEDQIYGGVRMRLLADGEESQLEGPVTVRLYSDRIGEQTGETSLPGESSQPEEFPQQEVNLEAGLSPDGDNQEATPAEIPEQIIRQGPGVVWAYINGEEITSLRRLDSDGTLIVQQEEADYRDEWMEEPVVAAGEETGISLLAVNPDGEWMETVEWGITGQGWIQTETDELPGAYVAAAQGEYLTDGWTGTYEDEEIFISVTVPGVHTMSETAGLFVDKVASSSETGGKEEYETLWNGAQKTLSQGVFSAVFYDIQIEDPESGGTVPLAELGENGASASVRVRLKNGLPHMDLDGNLEILHYDGEESPPEVLDAVDGRAQERGKQDALTTSFQTGELGQFGFVWANPVEGVETGGPGTAAFAGSGILIMLGAVWLWKRRFAEGS